MAETTTATDEQSDEMKSQEDILQSQIDNALTELERPADGLLLSALSAGLDIGFGPLLMAVLLTVAGLSFGSEIVTELLLANAYAIGFVFVVLGRSELFTEYTTLAVLPVLDGQASVARLLRLWGLVYVGNIVGSVLFAGAVVVVMPAMGIVDPAAFVEVARPLVDHSLPAMVAAGAFAGWLMGLMSWLVAAADSSAARFLFVWIVATAIGLAHLPHSIAGTVEVLAGVLAGPEIGLVAFGRFLLAATVGNAIGGSVFVALLKYGHVVRSGPPAEDV